MVAINVTAISVCRTDGDYAPGGGINANDVTVSRSTVSDSSAPFRHFRIVVRRAAQEKQGV
jgi:hypothetical protein